MKTQTAEEYFNKNYKSSTVNVVEMMKGYTTTQIEALRERLKQNAPSNLAEHSIDETINNFLKEINDELI
jgi:hypothetical protein